MVYFIFIQILIENLQANTGNPDQMPRSVASGLHLHCSPMSHKWEAMPIWAKCLLLAPINALDSAVI